MPALIGPIGSVVNMNQAVNGNAAGNPVYISQLNVAESAALGGVAALIASYNSQLASSASATLATTVLNNMFVTTAAGVPAANVTALTTALTQAFDAYPTAKGQVISNLSNLLGNLESDANWGPAARAFNNQAAANYSYSVNTANTNSGTPSSSTVTTYTLTTSADGPGAAAPAVNTTGTGGNDTYNGTFSSNAAANADNGTFNSADNLAGGNGTDLAIFRILTAFGTAETTGAAGVQDFRAPLMSSVETVLATNLNAVVQANTVYPTNVAAGATAAGAATGIATINLVSATGTTTVGSQNSSANTFTEFSNVANGTSITLDNADGYTAVNILGATSRAGTADALNVTISNGSGPTAASAAATGNFGVFTTLSTASAANTAPVVDNTFEVLNITTAGAFSRVNADVGTASAANSVTTVNVSGTGTAAASGFALQLSQNQAFQNVTTINASGMTGTGGLYIVAGNNNQNLTFTGSANNDRIDLGAITNLTSGDRFTFGLGTDTIGFNDANNSTYSDIQKGLIVASGAERVAFYGAMTNTDLSGYTGINSFSVGSGAAQTSVANAITGIATAQTIIIANDMTGAAGATGNPGATPADTLTLTGAGVGTTANLSLGGGIDITGGVGGAGAANTNAGGAGSNAIDYNGNITTLTIASTGTSVNTIIGGAGGAGNAGAGNANGGAGAAAITSGTVQAYVITGTQDITILGGAGGAANLAGTAGAQAAGFSAAASINATGLTTGVLWTSGSNGRDVISTGAGGSKLTTVTTATVGTSGDGDSMTLNTGRDQVQVTVNSSNVSAAGLSAANLDVVTGFTAGTDKFVYTAASLTAVQQGALYTAAGTGTLSTDIGTALTAGGAFVINSAAVVTITGTGAGTYLVINDGTAAFDKDLDAVVQLVGLSGTLSTGDFVSALLT